MKRIKVKVIGKGDEEDAYRVDLPTYTIDCLRDINGKPILLKDTNTPYQDSMDYIKMECFVMVPDDETSFVNGKWTLDQAKIRAKYGSNWSNFDKSQVEL